MEPTNFSALVGFFVTLNPLMLAVPLSGLISEVSTFIDVVLPAPFGPR